MFGAIPDSHGPRLSLGRKLCHLNWGLLFLIALIASIGFAMLYSAAEGSLEPWAGKQIVRFGIGCAIMVVLALTDIRVWLRWAYLIYAVLLVLLVGVEVAGMVGMGARRWIVLGPITLQPSELMKIGLVLALARYFHRLDEDQVNRLYALLPPLLMVAVPAALVLRQPDLGTATMLVAGSAVLFFLAGVRWWKFVLVAALGAAAVPVAWNMLHDYQRQRVLTFLEPERDPLGAGYHIIQSKIALGSGGMFGKGFMQGSQSQLDFLPEKQTDFIFTMLTEELGLAGGLFLLVLYALVIFCCYAIALRSRNQFGRLLGLGVTATFFLYAFINMAMVMGVLPVVGVPLPLVSYGGSALITLQIGFGLLLSVSVHRDVWISRGPGMPD